MHKIRLINRLVTFREGVIITNPISADFWIMFASAYNVCHACLLSVPIYPIPIFDLDLNYTIVTILFLLHSIL